jgi:Tfp pilus assembly protein PilN
MRKTLLSMALLSSVALAHASEDKIKILEEQIKLLQEEVQKLKQEQASVKEVKEENESINKRRA